MWSLDFAPPLPIYTQNSYKNSNENSFFVLALQNSSPTELVRPLQESSLWLALAMSLWLALAMLPLDTAPPPPSPVPVVEGVGAA
jgi:hypothetical protein